jgi:hypothetical protein
MLIQGGAGAGKTLFSRYLERHLWQHLSNGFIPVFVSLPKAVDPYSKLVNHALQDLGFGDFSTDYLTTEKFVFILDGLDELPLEKVPTAGIINSNGMLLLPNVSVIITCRNHYITALEAKLGATSHEHLAQQFTNVTDVFMMPFDSSQVFCILLVFFLVRLISLSDQQISCRILSDS